ncbi:MAG: hypothetical protein EAZ47_03360, partial [Bacteroidetes bacterium]
STIFNLLPTRASNSTKTSNSITISMACMAFFYKLKVICFENLLKTKSPGKIRGFCILEIF